MNLSKKRYLELQEQEDIYLNKRRSDKGFQQVIYRTRDRQRPEVFESQIKYSFLQYIRVAFEWATRKYDISRDHVELLLYMLPIGIFNKFQIDDMCRTVSIRPKRTFELLLEKGFIKVWREKRHGQLELYTLTQKATYMCTLIHKMVIGEETVPHGEQSVFNQPKKASNQYFLSVIKEMEQKKAERDSNPS